MTDYNDGKWHGWNGGECPVHPKSIVQAMEENGSGWKSEAENCDWRLMCGAFRVTKEYREPREFWICIYDGLAWDTEYEAKANNHGDGLIYHVVGRPIE